MDSCISSPRRPSRCGALTWLFIGLTLNAAACGDDEGATSGGGGSTSATTTGSSAPTTTSASSAGQGGGTTEGSGGKGGDEPGAGGGGGGAGGSGSACDGAIAGESCDVDGVSCESVRGQSFCDDEMPQITSCVGGEWEIWAAISCGAFEPGDGCDIPGTYLVEPSGAWDPPEEEYLVDRFGGPFEVSFEVRDDGRLYATSDLGSVDPASCEVSLYAMLEESCDEKGGESFCSYHDRHLDLNLSDDPGTGQVELECWGECGNTAVAPVAATRQ